MADAGDIIYRSLVVVIFIILMSSFLTLLEHFIGKIIRENEKFNNIRPLLANLTNLKATY